MLVNLRLITVIFAHGVTLFLLTTSGCLYSNLLYRSLWTSLVWPCSKRMACSYIKQTSSEYTYLDGNPLIFRNPPQQAWARETTPGSRGPNRDCLSIFLSASPQAKNVSFGRLSRRVTSPPIKKKSLFFCERESWREDF